MSVQQLSRLCDQCDDPVLVGPLGWYRCRSCGYESLRSFVRRSPIDYMPPVIGREAADDMGLSLSPSKETNS